MVTGGAHALERGGATCPVRHAVHVAAPPEDHVLTPQGSAAEPAGQKKAGGQLTQVEDAI